MARDYGKVRHRFWTGETGKEIRSMGSDARVVAAYLITCGSSNMIGLYYIPATLIAHETGIPMEGALKALRRLAEVGFSYYDEDEEVAFVPRMAAEQIAERLSATDKQCQGVASALLEYRKSRFFPEFVALYKDAFNLPDSFVEVCPIEAPSKPHRSQEQDQEQEQRTGSGTRTETEGGQAEKIRTVHAHHRTHHPKSAPEILSGTKEWRLIRDRLKEGHTVDTLCKAIDGYHKSPWHCGENDNRTKYLDLALIMRDQSHVAKGVEMDDKPPAKPNNAVGQQNLRIGHGRAEDADNSQEGEIPL